MLSCALRYMPIVKIQYYCILILTNIIGTGTLDHCTFDKYYSGCGWVNHHCYYKHSALGYMNLAQPGV